MKDKDAYVFTSDRKLNQMLRRETIMIDVPKVMHSVSNLCHLLTSKPNANFLLVSNPFGMPGLPWRSPTIIGRKQFRSAQNQWNYGRNFPYIKRVAPFFSKKYDGIMRIYTLVIPYTHLNFRDISHKYFCYGFSNPGNVLTILNVESYYKSSLFLLVIGLIMVNTF